MALVAEFPEEFVFEGLPTYLQDTTTIELIACLQFLVVPNEYQMKAGDWPRASRDDETAFLQHLLLFPYTLEDANGHLTAILLTMIFPTTQYSKV